MKQINLGNESEMAAKRTRKYAFLEEMERVVPCAQLMALIMSHMPAGKTGRPPYSVRLLLRIHLMQQWVGFANPAIEEALYDIPLYWQNTPSEASEQSHSCRGLMKRIAQLVTLFALSNLWMVHKHILLREAHG